MTEKKTQSWIQYSFFLAMVLFGSQLSVFAQVAEKPSGFIDFNGYYDTREYSVLTYNILANLPKRIQYFSLTNYQGKDANSDVSNFYAEHNLRYEFIESKPIDATVQYVIISGENNDKLRLGLRWRINDFKALSEKMKKLRITYSINPMFVEFGARRNPKYGTTIEHVYSIQLIKNKLYLAGFADQNFIKNGNAVKTFWVTEHQLGYCIIDQLFAVAEFRVNEFQTGQDTGLGFGLEYKIRF